MTIIRTVACTIGLIAALWGLPPALAETIVDEWTSVKTPPAPALKPAVIDPKTAALLVLDFVRQTCNAERRPRCVASVPKVRGLLDEAQNKGVLVVHGVVSGQERFGHRP